MHSCICIYVCICAYLNTKFRCRIFVTFQKLYLMEYLLDLHQAYGITRGHVYNIKIHHPEHDGT